MELFRSWGIDEAVRQGGWHVIAATGDRTVARLARHRRGAARLPDRGRQRSRQPDAGRGEPAGPPRTGAPRLLPCPRPGRSSLLDRARRLRAGRGRRHRHAPRPGDRHDVRHPLSVPRRGRRPSQHRPDDARDPDGRTGRPRSVHEHPVPRGPPADPRRHTLRAVHARGPGPADESSSRAGPTTGSCWPSRCRPAWTTRPSTAAFPIPTLHRAGPRGGWRPDLEVEHPRDERLPVQRPGRGADRRGPGRPRGRRGAPDDAARRPWHEHGHRRRATTSAGGSRGSAAASPTRPCSRPGRRSVARSGHGTSSCRWPRAVAGRPMG